MHVFPTAECQAYVAKKRVCPSYVETKSKACNQYINLIVCGGIEGV